MPSQNDSSFNATIELIGINPFVFVPDKILDALFKTAGREKGPIPIRGAINGKPYRQTLVKYRNAWRLYINTSMLTSSPKRIGEKITISIEVDVESREIAMPPAFVKALNVNKEAGAVFKNLTPSRKKEIVRYLANLKTAESLEKNLKKAICFLTGQEKFAGRTLNTGKKKQMQGKENEMPQMQPAPRQNKHERKDAWHVIQQSKGRAIPTKPNSSNMMIINEDAALEKEADTMGDQAMKSIQKKKKK